MEATLKTRTFGDSVGFLAGVSLDNRRSPCADFFARTDLDADYRNATLRVDLDITNRLPQEANCQVSVELLDANSKPFAHSR